MRIGIAADHAGVRLKDELVRHLRETGHQITDRSPVPTDPNDDYPLIVAPLARALARGEFERALFCCGSGIGPAVAANKVAGGRAAVVSDEWAARDAVEHVDVNLLTMGEKVVGSALAVSIVDAYLAAVTQGGRHERRRHQIAEMETRP